MSKLVDKISNESLGVDVENFNLLKAGLIEFSNTTQDRINNVVDYEQKRSYISIFIFLFYLIISGLSFFGFFKRQAKLLLGLSLILIFSLPALLIFEGLTTSYYFIYSDVCEDVHGAIYENKFPIADQGLGYLINCFNADTKSKLYSFAYDLDVADNEITQRTTTSNYDSFDIQIKKEINIVKEGPLKEMLACSHVYKFTTFFEQRFCVDGMEWSKNLLTCYTWLFVIILLCAYAINRLKPLVEKKKTEIESMLMNEDLIE